MKKQGINETDGEVAKVIDASGQKADNLLTLSTGVVLMAKQASPSMMIRVMTSRERPEPPMVFMQAMGREMENPDDPDYIKRVNAWEMSYNNSILNALIALGTELVSKPKDMEGPHPKVKPFVKCVSCGTRNNYDAQSCSKCGVPVPEAEVERLQWIEDYMALGLPVHPESKSWRYTTWVMFVAAPKDTDITLIGEKVKGLSGVKEADVQSAETFSGRN